MCAHTKVLKNRSGQSGHISECWSKILVYPAKNCRQTEHGRRQPVLPSLSSMHPFFQRMWIESPHNKYRAFG